MVSANVNVGRFEVPYSSAAANYLAENYMRLRSICEKDCADEINHCGRSDLGFKEEIDISIAFNQWQDIKLQVVAKPNTLAEKLDALMQMYQSGKLLQS